MISFTTITFLKKFLIINNIISIKKSYPKIFTKYSFKIKIMKNSSLKEYIGNFAESENSINIYLIFLYMIYFLSILIVNNAKNIIPYYII